MNRRRFLAGAAALGASPATAPLTDGRSVLIGEREYVLSDIIAPSAAPLSGKPEAAADFALAVLRQALRAGAPIGRGAAATDRWGRIVGPVPWRMDGRETSLQEILVAQGAARVAPQSEDHGYIDRCFAAEKAARDSRLGLWAHPAYRIRDASRAEWASGWQIYAGPIVSAADSGGRVYFNFGEDYKTDFTATVAKSPFRRWKNPPDLAACAGRAVETRGFVERINGPSIEIRHERQLRFM